MGHPLRHPHPPPRGRPADAGFTFVNGLDDAVAQATAANGNDVHIMGGADVIRQALAASHVQELTISIAPVILGGGKRLFDDTTPPSRLEHVGLLRSPFATHITYRVLR